MSESIITLKTVKNIIERRKREIHKGDCGRILIAAGSRGMAGAAVLAARGALRAGSGLVQLAVPGEIFPIVQAGVLEATCLDDDLSAVDFGRYDAAAIGPGLGTGPASVEKVKTILKYYEGPLVIDADGLNVLAALAGDKAGESDSTAFDRIRHRAQKGHRTIITPHIGEARRLMGDDYDSDMSSEQLAKALAAKTGAITVLKGAGTVVALPEGQTYTNTTGNPGMATAGSGDVLTGIAASMLALGYSAYEAGVLAVYIHARAGDYAALTKNEYSMLAGDICEALTAVLG